MPLYDNNLIVLIIDILYYRYIYDRYNIIDTINWSFLSIIPNIFYF